MSEEFEVHGEHDHAVEHAAHSNALARWVAMFTAVLATLGALISYQNGAAESQGMELKNEAILEKSAASDQWAYYQAKGIKEVILENAAGAGAADKARLVAEAQRYAAEKKDIEEHARKLDEESAAHDKASAKALAPRPRLALGLALIQVAIAVAALTVLTQQRWMLLVSGTFAVASIGCWISAWMMA